MRKRFMKSKKGFTLIELIVVLAILGVILSIAIPRYTGLQDSAELKADESTAALIVRSARLMEANEGLDSGGVIGEMEATDDQVNVTDDGIAGTTVTYLDPVGNAQSNGEPFMLEYNEPNYEVIWGNNTYTENEDL